MTTDKRLSRRTLLRAAGLLGAGAAVSPYSFFEEFGQIKAAAAAATPRKNLIVVRSLFDFRDPAQTNFNNYLAPLQPWQTSMGLARGLSADGGGSEYHNGKQIRFATSCTPTNRTNRTNGGGDYDGKSFDVVAGEHLQTTSGARHPYLVLGAAPYSVAGLHATFETITFANKNQYVRPEYNLGSLQDQIAANATFCDGTQPTVDVPGLQQENRVLEQVMLDLRRSREFKSAEVIGQAETLEKQFEALRDQNNLSLVAAPDCTEARGSALTHDYSRPAIMTAAYDRQLREMNYTAALALKTNFTNSVTLNYNFSGHGQPNVPAFHDMTHPGGFSRPPSSQELTNLDQLSQFQMQMFAHLLRELGDMGVLDDTLVVYSPHERPTHNHNDVVVITHGAGRVGTYNSDRRVQDLGKDVLDHFGAASGNFGGERSLGGIIV